MRATCPDCGEVVEGDFATVTKHVKKCPNVVVMRERGFYHGREKEIEAAMRSAVAQPEPVMFNASVPFYIHCERAILSQNANHGWHWTKKDKERKGWRDHLEGHLHWRGVLGVRLVFSRWSIERVIRPPARMYDYANLVGGTKPIPDALIQLGIIVDDSPKHFQCVYDQRPVAYWEDLPETTNTVICLIEARQ